MQVWSAAGMGRRRESCVVFLGPWLTYLYNMHTYVESRFLSLGCCPRCVSGLSCVEQVSLPEIDGAIEPIIYAGREGATGRSVPLADRVQLVADRALKVRHGEQLSRPAHNTLHHAPLPSWVVGAG